MSALRVGTRGSALALAQANWVAARLDAEVVVLRTSGDAGGPGGAPGDKSRWVDTIEAALVAGEIDLAVHSAKDVPGMLAEGTEIVASPPRASAHDVLIGSVHDDGAPRIGTSSLRRRAQLLAAHPGWEVVGLRGNVETRLGKLAAGEVDALVLAAAGLERLDRAQGEPLQGELFVPAPGQGALVLQARSGDDRAAALNDPATLACLLAERAAARVLGADCRTPVGVHADGRRIRGFAGRADGSAWVLDELDGLDGEELGRRMLAAGAREILA